MKKVIASLVGFIILITILLITNFNAPKIDLTIYAKDDSFASKYANKHSLNLEKVSSSEEDEFYIAIEEFEYNKTDDGIEIVSYSGISKKLVIPEKIDGYQVVSINDSLFENKNIEAIVISNKVKNVESENIKIECMKSPYCESLVADDNVDAIMLNDSTNIDFSNYNGLVEYNLKNDEIEVTKSISINNATIIPVSINGYTVTSINVDLENISKIYVPESVSNINLKGVDYFYSHIVIVMSISYILYLIMVLIDKHENLNSTTNSVALYIVSILYLLVIGYFSINYSVIYYIQVIIASLIYIVLGILLKINKKQSIKYENKVKEQTMFIEETLNILDSVDSEDKYELKEIIRYSDPVSIEEVKDIEKEIKDKISNIDSDVASEIKELIKKRNNIIKSKK